MRVPRYISYPIIRFWSRCDRCHELLQLYVWMEIRRGHWESDIQECEFFLAINKDDLCSVWLRFLSGMVFRTFL